MRPVQRLLQTCLDIALWRKGPQDLPASSTVCWFLALLYLGISFVQVHVFHYSLVVGVTRVIVDFAMQAAWVALLLGLFSRLQRFPQTFSAMLGVGVLLAALDLLVQSVLMLVGADRSLGVEWVLLHLVVVVLVVGRILMQALDRGLFTGMALVLAMIISTETVTKLVLRQFVLRQL
jgi:hypothetical protein